MIIDDVTTGALVGALRGTLARHRALTQNLANADTPGYQRVDVAFETSLARAVETEAMAFTAESPQLEAALVELLSVRGMVEGRA